MFFGIVKIGSNKVYIKNDRDSLKVGDKVKIKWGPSNSGYVTAEIIEEVYEDDIPQGKSIHWASLVK